ncbi:MAG TPA: GDSL-type esterase/lipase family protein, partial [Pilimelia sp.]|nr:GDSL-type esterase/lipase family protein [Pilimelia sp.]
MAALAAVLPWRPAADPPPARAAQDDDPVRIMAMGDSITWGTGSRDGDGWREPLRARLAAAGYRVDLVGPLRQGRGPDRDLAGYPGWRVDQLRGRAPGYVAAYAPDVVLLHIGTNDLRRGQRPRDVAQRLAGLVGEL